MTAILEETISQLVSEETDESTVIFVLQDLFKQKSGLIQQYTESTAEIENTPVQHLLNMAKINSLMHMDICLLAIALLKGESLAEPEKRAFNSAFKVYRELEKSSKKRTRTISKNLWVKENKGLKKLISLATDGDKRNKKLLQRAVDKLVGKNDIQPLDMNPRVLDTLVRRISVILEEIGNSANIAQ